jgi:hypothetical protein
MVPQVNKIELFFKDRIIERLRKLDTCNGFRVIRFPAIIHDFAVFFHFNKKETFFVLKELQQEGVITIHPYNGIKLTKEAQKGVID